LLILTNLFCKDNTNFIIEQIVVSINGTKEKHIAHVISNEDKDRIIEWKEIKNNSVDK
jgi:hypothetical protein